MTSLHQILILFLAPLSQQFSQWFVVDTTTAKAFGSNLWFTPWIFDSSYCAYVRLLQWLSSFDWTRTDCFPSTLQVTHIMLGNLSSNRYYVYFLLGFFSWCSFNFFAVSGPIVVLSLEVAYV